MRRNELITITAVSSNCEPMQVEKIIDALPRTQDMPICKVERIVSFKATRTLKRKLKQSDEEYIQALKKQGAELQIEHMKHP